MAQQQSQNYQGMLINGTFRAEFEFRQRRQKGSMAFKTLF
jgi:hypothetical protein